jgi:predicted metallopeptidase
MSSVCILKGSAYFAVVVAKLVAEISSKRRAAARIYGLKPYFRENTLIRPLPAEKIR